MRLTVLLLVLAAVLNAEVRTLTLRQTIDLAVRQNPEVLIARLDEQKAAAAAREARDPFTPKLFAGSGLAYTNGFPMSIESSAPSLFQTRAIQTIYNRNLSFQAAAAKETVRGAAIEADIRREEVVHRVVLSYLSAARLARVAELVKQQLASFDAISSAVHARVEEGRELPVEARAADLRVAQTRQRLRTLETERDSIEASLAVALGMGADDRVRAADEKPEAVEMPPNETAAIETALENSKQLKQMESAMQAKQLQARGARSSRYPQVDLLAQYAVLAKFNRYEEFFKSFERHNWQLGLSFQIPVFAGSGHDARAEQAEADLSRLRIQMNDTRNRIAAEARRSWHELRDAESARDVAKLDLDITRERLSVVLAQFEEGRASIRQVEELRSAESEKWLAFFDAQNAVERARVELLRQTGSMLALAY